MSCEDCENEGRMGGRVITPLGKAARDLYLAQRGIDPGGNFSAYSDCEWSEYGRSMAILIGERMSLALAALVEHIGPNCADERLFNLRVNAEILVVAFREMLAEDPNLPARRTPSGRLICPRCGSIGTHSEGCASVI